jgi:hypothetical protein
MKKYLILILITVCSKLSFAQKDSVESKSGKIGIELSIVSPSGLLGQWSMAPLLRYSIKKHTVFLGPALILRPPTLEGPSLNIHNQFLQRYYVNHFIDRFGIMAGYQWHPFREAKRVKIYFEYNLNYYHYKYGLMSHPPTRLYTDYIVTNTVGYVLKFSFFKRLYAFQSLGIGWRSFISKYPQSSKLYNNNYSAYIVRFGIGYNFK